MLERLFFIFIMTTLQLLPRLPSFYNQFLQGNSLYIFGKILFKNHKYDLKENSIIKLSNLVDLLKHL